MSGHHLLSLAINTTILDRKYEISGLGHLLKHGKSVANDGKKPGKN
jgi:hypothetical protein